MAVQEASSRESAETETQRERATAGRVVNILRSSDESWSAGAGTAKERAGVGTLNSKDQKSRPRRPRARVCCVKCIRQRFQEKKTPNGVLGES